MAWLKWHGVCDVNCRHRLSSQHEVNFCHAPFRDWFQFDAFEYRYTPPAPVKRDERDGWDKRLHAKVCCFYWKAPENALWLSFSNERQFRCSEDRTSWFQYHTRPSVDRLHFVIDDVYCGADFIMVQLADAAWPRWMVVWIHHSSPSCCGESRHGRLERRRKQHWLAAWRATYRVASKTQDWLNWEGNVLALASRPL